ncbi:rod shape-determining protein MreD [Cohnella fermenti]|uniref:Rod shape-determining protein MreD n=1 Tax=Cohnella fermenti TaxID=2565925 RepID=A0A4S4C781_9BACL|nr:rod shape-determining protein MreD [Cohnella fermenti]THF83799.1 rod shape-determining protein MreD [Cohnella fermenti]
MRMNRTILLTLLLLMVQTSIFPWLVPSSWSARVLPHLPLVMTVFVALFGGRYKAFFFGLGFGLLEDVLFFGELLGTYGFAMAFIGYFIGLVGERRSHLISFMLISIGVGSLAMDTIVYFVYKMFRLTGDTYLFALYWQIVPTLLAHIAFALLLYVPIRRKLAKAGAGSGEEKTAA